MQSGYEWPLSMVIPQKTNWVCYPQFLPVTLLSSFLKMFARSKKKPQTIRLSKEGIPALQTENHFESCPFTFIAIWYVVRCLYMGIFTDLIICWCFSLFAWKPDSLCPLKRQSQEMVSDHSIHGTFLHREFERQHPAWHVVLSLCRKGLLCLLGEAWFILKALAFPETFQGYRLTE